MPRRTAPREESGLAVADDPNAVVSNAKRSIIELAEQGIREQELVKAELWKGLLEIRQKLIRVLQLPDGEQKEPPEDPLEVISIVKSNAVTQAWVTPDVEKLRADFESAVKILTLLQEIAGRPKDGEPGKKAVAKKPAREKSHPTTKGSRAESAGSPGLDIVEKAILHGIEVGEAIHTTSALKGELDIGLGKVHDRVQKLLGKGFLRREGPASGPGVKYIREK